MKPTQSCIALESGTTETVPHDGKGNYNTLGFSRSVTGLKQTSLTYTQYSNLLAGHWEARTLSRCLVSSPRTSIHLHGFLARRDKMVVAAVISLPS